MNIDRVNIAIAIMKRAGIVDMRNWQQVKYTAHTTEAELHACGTAACFAGWIAVSPEWKEYGGEVTAVGCPFNRNTLVMSTEAELGEWMDLDPDIVKMFIYGDIYQRPLVVMDDGNYYSVFYGKRWLDVKAADIIEKLEALLQPDGIKTLVLEYKNKLNSYPIPEVDFNISHSNKLNIDIKLDRLLA